MLVFEYGCKDTKKIFYIEKNEEKYSKKAKNRPLEACFRCYDAYLRTTRRFWRSM